MEDRIKIGDVWYVKEDSLERGIKITEEKEPLDIILSRHVLVETDEVAVDGSVLEIETDLEPGVMVLEESKYSMASVEITFKNSDRATEHWDNDAFLIGVAQRDDKWLKEMDFDNDIGDKTKEVVIAVIDKMHELNYI